MIMMVAIDMCMYTILPGSSSSDDMYTAVLCVEAATVIMAITNKIIE